MFCPNCGGEFAEWAPKCPYCGNMNPKGAEKEYMAHMEELKNRLDQVDEESEKDYQKTMGKAAKRLLIFVGAAAALIILVFVALNIWQKKQDEKAEARQIAEEAWQKEEFVKLDEMYAKGDYEGIIDEYYATLGENHNIYSWEHYEYVMEFYVYYADMLAAKNQIEGKVGDTYTLGKGLYGALYLTKMVSDDQISRLEENYQSTQRSPGLTKEEGKLVREYQTEARDFLETKINWTQAEIDSFYESCSRDGDFSTAMCYEKAEELAEGFGWIRDDDQD